MNRIYRDPEPVEPVGGAAPTPAEAAPVTPVPESDKGDAIDRMVEEQEQAPEAEPETPPAPIEPEAPAAPVTPLPTDALADAIKGLQDVVKGAKAEAKPPEPAAPEAPEMKLFEFSEEDADALIEGGAKAKGVLDKASKAITAQSVQIAILVAQKMIEPLQAQYQQQVVQEAEKSYLKKYPDHEGFEDYARDVANRLLQSGKRWENRDTFFAEIKSETDKVIEQHRKRFGGAMPPKAPVAGAVPNAPSPTPAGAPRSNGKDKDGLNEEQLLMRDVSTL